VAVLFEDLCLSHFGDVPVASVDTEHVLAALQPIWRTKTETATRVRARIEMILDGEKVRRHRMGENPARWRDHLRQILPAARKIAPVEHHAALPYAEMPAFFRQIQEAKGIGARALEFTALTVGRTGMTLGAVWSEVDLVPDVIDSEKVLRIDVSAVGAMLELG